jgi:hypothetical protein
MTTPNAHNPSNHPMTAIDELLTSADGELKRYIEQKIEARLRKIDEQLIMLTERSSAQQDFIGSMQTKLGNNQSTRSELKPQTTPTSPTRGAKKYQDFYLNSIHSLTEREIIPKKAMRKDFETMLKILDDSISDLKLSQEVASVIAIKMLSLSAEKPKSYKAVCTELAKINSSNSFIESSKEKKDTDIFPYLFEFIVALSARS